MDKGTMTVKEMQDFLAIGRVTAYRLANSAGFPTIRIGRKILISREGLKRWMAEKEGEASEDSRLPFSW